MKSPTPPALAFLWSKEVKESDLDRHVAFRGVLEVGAPTEIEISLLASSWFNLWIDDAFLAEGPARYPAGFPEYQTSTVRLAPGRHVLAAQVNHTGVSTRLLEPISPFFACAAAGKSGPVEIAWKCAPLDAFTPAVRRVNPQLGYIEWCDTAKLPAWRSADFDDAPWTTPISVTPAIGPLKPLSIALPIAEMHALTPIASGELIEAFGYERDDVPARFFLRELGPGLPLPAQGVWRRYDLGRVRLMRPKFELDLPAGAVVEFSYCEALRSGRVAPWITLSGGDSCNLDHYVAKGGKQTFFPLTPRGGRFLEVHIIAPPASVKFLGEAVMERAYYGPAEGALETPDALLNRIWSTGVATHRACAEDAVTDNPTRERGEWAGDVVTVGMEIAGAAFADLRLCRRSLMHSAQCAREDGMVAGLCPGGAAYLTTYAAQWLGACHRYWMLSGDRALLEAMLPYAEKNVAAFETQRTADGLDDKLGWGFVDWGYVRNPGPTDIAVNLHYLAGLRSLKAWCDALGKKEAAHRYEKVAGEVVATVARYFHTELATPQDAWTRIGYHRAVLGLAHRFFDATQTRECLAFLKAHILRCFPNNPSAPRLSDPFANNPQLITPYFGHFALPVLIEHGEMEFVLEQFRHCWGWMLDENRTTWIEVFDTRWSHCHQWAGCPTWQLSRYLLGLNPRFDLGGNHYDVSLATGSLTKAAGQRPLGLGKSIEISWEKSQDTLRYRVKTPEPIVLHVSATLEGGKARTVNVASEFEATWPVNACR